MSNIRVTSKNVKQAYVVSAKSSNVDAKTDFYEPSLADLKAKIKKDYSPSNIQTSQTAVRSIFMNCVIIGNPFLTYRFNVTKAFLNKHNLRLTEIYWIKNNDKTVLNDALASFPNDVELTSGEDTTNIAITAQSMSLQPKSFVLIGVKSADEDSVELIKTFKNAQLSLKLDEKKGSRTNILAILSFKNSWCEIYYFDPTCTLYATYLDKPIVTKVLERSNVLFSTDNSIFMMPATVKKLAYYSSASFKLFCVSLYNAQILAQIKNDLKTILAFTDVLFMTKQSARAMIKMYEIPASKLPQCFQTVNQLPKILAGWLKTFSKKTCLVVICDGLKEASLTTDIQKEQTGKYSSYYFKNTQIVDMYGTHQAFIGGFLSMLIQGYTVELCLDYGFFCGSMVAGQIGVKFPENKIQRLEEWIDLHLTDYKKNRKCASNMAISFFHTPWKLQDMEEGATISS
ncbi:adenosine kinase-like [Biomphalaria glabrata]|uniref:adenosine kinase n=1 Tax=Biomphalaria glabrata TaxID=6526 RepID=A0A9W2ZQI5_BIOGL|nr:adenosine kinase-like [Biomphalaria glabrata]